MREHIRAGLRDRLSALKALTADPSQHAYEGRGLWDTSTVHANWSACQRRLQEIEDEIESMMWDFTGPDHG